MKLNKRGFLVRISANVFFNKEHAKIKQRYFWFAVTLKYMSNGCIYISQKRVIIH